MRLIEEYKVFEKNERTTSTTNLVTGKLLKSVRKRNG